jgi:L-ascorbate metabolism protein UlaG (beta-lactamase superfamily)
MNKLFANLLILIITNLNMNGQKQIEKDIFETSSGKLTLYFFGHASLLFEINKKIIYIDPVGRYADYGNLPKAEIILITHHHQDHFDTIAISKITQKNTQIVLTPEVYSEFNKGIILKNGDKIVLDSIEIEAVPAYNTSPGRDKYHPKGRDNGYVITIGNKKIYVAGDTENIPEMTLLKNIDIAFLPMNQPYTMLPEQVAEAVKRFKPKVLYPYHYGDTDVKIIQKLLADDKNTEVRIRDLR